MSLSWKRCVAGGFVLLLLVGLAARSVQASSLLVGNGTSDEGGVKVVAVEIPEIAWNTNRAHITVRNRDDRPHQVDVHFQYTNLSLAGGGIGWNSQHTAAAGRETAIEREFMVKPLPGKVRVRLTIRDLTADAQLMQRDYTTEFALVNTRIHPLSLPAHIPGKRREYPRLESVESEHFIFYFPEDDSFAREHVAGLGHKREAAYAQLVARLNPQFNNRMVFLLFPDGETKFAYTLHRGWGWSVGGKVIAEIFNREQEVDPNHELVHAITAPLGTPPALFDEGLAVYLQEEELWEGYPVDSWARAFAARGVSTPLGELFAFADIGSPESKPLIAYPQAGSVVRYLVERYGMRKFLAAFGELRGSREEVTLRENTEKFREIFGLSVPELERSWLESIRSKVLEEIPEAKVNEVVAAYQ